MKRNIRIFFAAVSMAVLITVPAQAAGKNAEYQASRMEFREVRTESCDAIRETEEKMDVLKAENKIISEKYTAIRKEKKETGSLSIDKENWKEAKSLRKEMKLLNSGWDKSAVKSLRAEAKELAAQNEYEAAAEKYKEAAGAKNEQLEQLEKVNKLWKQIDELLK